MLQNILSTLRVLLCIVAFYSQMRMVVVVIGSGLLACVVYC